MKTLSVLSRLIGLISLSFLLVACETSSVRPTATGESSVGEEQTASASPDKGRGSATLEQRLLIQAQEAFRLARYTTPQHNNAYDKFHSVLLLNPENPQARAGLQAILLRYAQLVRSAIERGRLRAANAYLNQAELFYPASALLMDLKQQIKAAKADQHKAQQVVQKVETPKDEYALSVSELSARSDAIKARLSDIALRVKDSDESVLIFARSDREGRWIYKQLKLAADGYRVRGDIRIAKAPKVRILPPL